MRVSRRYVNTKSAESPCLTIHLPLNSMASSLDQERIEFESHAGQMSLEQLTESLKANEKLIQLFELQRSHSPGS